MLQTLSPDNWVANYADMLFAYARPRVNDTQVAEDLVQETFLSAWKAREGFKGEASEKSWLFTILKNKIIDHYRKKAKDLIQTGNEKDATDAFFDQHEHWTDQDGPSNWSTAASDPLQQKEFYTVFEKCKKKLQVLQQSVFIMKYIDDLSADEICKALNITPSNYWVLIHRAKLGLRACLEKNWIQLS
jgi:RNA polymerase sigma-70 factor (TIGR02943 family)